MATTCFLSVSTVLSSRPRSFKGSTTPRRGARGESEPPSPLAPRPSPLAPRRGDALLPGEVLPGPLVDEEVLLTVVFEGGRGRELREAHLGHRVGHVLPRGVDLVVVQAHEEFHEPDDPVVQPPRQPG